jgi:hypothetical protein
LLLIVVFLDTCSMLKCTCTLLQVYIVQTITMAIYAEAKISMNMARDGFTMHLPRANNL